MVRDELCVFEVCTGIKRGMHYIDSRLSRPTSLPRVELSPVTKPLVSRCHIAGRCWFVHVRHATDWDAESVVSMRWDHASLALDDRAQPGSLSGGWGSVSTEPDLCAARGDGRGRAGEADPLVEDWRDVLVSEARLEVAQLSSVAITYSGAPDSQLSSVAYDIRDTSRVADRSHRSGPEAPFFGPLRVVSNKQRGQGRLSLRTRRLYARVEAA